MTVRITVLDMQPIVPASVIASAIETLRPAADARHIAHALPTDGVGARDNHQRLTGFADLVQRADGLAGVRGLARHQSGQHDSEALNNEIAFLHAFFDERDPGLRQVLDVLKKIGERMMLLRVHA